MSDAGKVDAKRFAQGLTYEQYIASVENNREEFKKHFEQVNLTPEDRQFFSNLSSRIGTRIKLLALGEDWCPDVVRALPIVAKIAETGPDLELRVFPRDENLDIMDQYLQDGKFRSIPTFVFFDENFNEIGRWVERPASVNSIVQEIKQIQSQQNLPQDQARQMMRQRLSELYASEIVPETIQEIKEILNKRG